MARIPMEVPVKTQELDTVVLPRTDPVRAQATIMAIRAYDRLEAAGHRPDFDSIVDRFDAKLRAIGLVSVIGPHGRPVAALPCPQPETQYVGRLAEAMVVFAAFAVTALIVWGLAELVG